MLTGILLSVTAYLDGNFLFAQLLLSRQEQALNDVKAMASHTRSTLDSWYSQLITVTNGLSITGNRTYRDVITGYARSNPDIVAFDLVKPGTSQGAVEVISAVTGSPEDKRFNGADPAAVHGNAIQKVRQILSDPRTTGQKHLIVNHFPDSGIPMMSVGLSFGLSGSEQVAWAVLTVWQTTLVSGYIPPQSGLVALVDPHFRILSVNSPEALSDPKTTRTGRQILFMRRQNTDAGFREWKFRGGEHHFGTWSDVGAYDLRVVSVTSGTPVYQALREINYRSLLLAVFVALLAIPITYFAASGTTRHLKELVRSAMAIAEGKFDAKVAVSSTDEVGVLGRAVNHMATELENLVQTRTEKARLESELQTAQMVQAAFIPEQSLQAGGLKIEAFYKPADACGGDWWGHFSLGDDQHLLAIADATGHGVPAALVTAMIYSMTSLMTGEARQRGDGSLSPAHMLQNFNKALCARGRDEHTLTVFLVLFDKKRGRVRFSNAGHNMPYRFSKPAQGSDGEYVKKTMQCSGNPLGMDPESTFVDQEMPLQPGDRFFFFTDGLIECTNPDKQQWGKQSLNRFLKKHAAADLAKMKEILVSDVFGFFNNHPLADDITVVIVEYLGAQEQSQPETLGETA